MERVARGALDGVIATIPQTLVQALGLAGRQAGRLPPQEIAAALAERAALDALKPGGPGFHPFWIAAHLGYGGVLGVAYRAVGTRLPGGSLAAGMAFGAAVWALHYAAVLPALGLYPPSRTDPPSRRRANMAAHAVFGLALGLLERRGR